MPENILASIFSSANAADLTLGQLFACLGAALACGFIIFISYSYKNSYTKSFAVTLTLLPAIISLIIMMVNGNLGAGVAVAGAFSLVRFRSVPGTAREICAIFLGMAAGLAAGMGYVAAALVFVAALSGINLLLSATPFGERRRSNRERSLRITIPEDLNYQTVFREIFEKYTDSWRLNGVKTSNMGSLFKLTYSVIMTDANKEKDMIDELRCRNGNLEISSSIPLPDDRSAL